MLASPVARTNRMLQNASGMAISTARKSLDPKCATNTQTRQIIWPRSRHRTDWRRQNNPKSMYFCRPGTPKPAEQKIATKRPPIHTLYSRTLAWPEADAKQTELFRTRPSLHNAHHRQRPPKRLPNHIPQCQRTCTLRQRKKSTPNQLGEG